MRRLLLLGVSVLALAPLSAGPLRGAEPPPPKRAAFVAIEGQGRVTSVPAGIDCPKTCRAFFVKDALVRLVARPAAGWSFVRWSGSCASTTTECSFNLTSAHDCAGRLCVVGAFGSRVAFVRRAQQVAQ